MLLCSCSGDYTIKRRADIPNNDVDCNAKNYKVIDLIMILNKTLNPQSHGMAALHELPRLILLALLRASAQGKVNCSKVMEMNM